VGPDGFHITITVFEFRPGGLWRYVMHAPHGASYPNEASVLAIEPDRGVVIAHTSQPHFQLTLRLQATATGTLATWIQAFESPEAAVALKHIVEPANEQKVASGSDRPPGAAG